MTTLETSLVELKQQFEARSGVPRWYANRGTVHSRPKGQGGRGGSSLLKVPELDESMSFLTENYAKLRGIVDSDAFLSTDFHWTRRLLNEERAEQAMRNMERSRAQRGN